MGQQQSIERSVRELKGKPYDPKLLEKLDSVFEKNPRHAHNSVWNVVREKGESRRRKRDAKWRSKQARESVRLALDAARRHPEGLSVFGDDTIQDAKDADDDGNSLTWSNCVGQQRSSPLMIVKPETLQQLVSVVTDAKSLRQHVRAVGSGHSFSDITQSDDAVMVDMVLLRRISMMDNGDDGITALTPPQPSLSPSRTPLEMSPVPEQEGDTGNRSRRLARVQAGITVRDLNTELDNRGLALINMGAFDGQTLGGLMSTGTHGSGVAFGPVSNCIRAIVLVSETGAVYQIEPASEVAGKGPLSDPSTFPGTIDGVSAKLKQDDNWFRAALVSIGCLGVIYSYVIEVTDAFYVREMRSATKWDEVRTDLLPELWDPVPPVLAAADHFELVLNPYMNWSKHSCVRVERTRLPGKAKPSGERKDWLSTVLEQFSIYSVSNLVTVLNRLPVISPIAINQAIGTLVESGPYVDKSYNVFNLGAANSIKALAVELQCDAKQCVPVIDKLLGIFQDEAKRHDWYMAGPLGIRFIGASDAFLAPEAGRLTCAIELDMLVDVETGAKLARTIKEHMCTDNTNSVRVHWGLDLDMVTSDDVRA